jgi:hypothetical protein
MPEDILPDFKRKVVHLQLSEAGLSWSVTDATFERQGDRLFLVGNPITQSVDSPKWWQGEKICVAWDKVVYYLLYSSVQEFRACMTRSKAPPQKPL